MQNKNIAVVITAYNYARYLDDCIQSVLTQSVKPDEIIVVDDESTDNTKEVVEKYPVKYVWQKNKGLAGARNTGISHVTSDFVMCLDADDMLRPDAIKEHLKIADKNAIAQCGLTYFGSENVTFRPMGATLESLLKNNSVYCNSVFPRWVWEKIKYDESDTMRLGLEDWLYWTEIMTLGLEVKTSDYIALLYRRHPQAMTKQTTHPNWNKICDYMEKKLKDIYNLDFTARRL